MTPSALPAGDPVPADGSLPDDALAELVGQPLSIYLHVPFCTTRCGYCDFNTYTAAELGSGVRPSSGVAPTGNADGYADSVIAELDLARQVLGDRPAGVSTVFVGGGTPTLLDPDDLGRMLAAVDERFGLLPDAEVSTESNPESITADGLKRLVQQGFNRVSFGMQSAVPHVLAVLDRIHSVGRPEQAVAEARAAGFTSVSLDLIYGTPGESVADWQTSLAGALAAEPDHLSAYALIVEPGTRLAGSIKRGLLTTPDDDDLADKYLLAEQTLSGAGLHAYELSNWARTRADQCRHNLAYWTGAPWWGAGPGAHSHVGGVRWWNVKHPAAYATRLTHGQSPGFARELLAPPDRRVERIMLELRLAVGLPVAVLSATEQARVADLVARNLCEPVPGHGENLRLTLPGRLLADAVVRDLID